MRTERAGAAPRKRARGGQPGNSNALKHGAYRRRRALNEIDWTTQLDRRTALYRELRERAERIVANAGGVDAIGPQRAALAPHAAQIEVELETLNQAIREVGPVDRRRHVARRIVEDRNKLLRAYRELLTMIGLDAAALVRADGATWHHLARRHAIAPPRGSQSDDGGDSGMVGDSGSVVDHDLDLMGSPRLDSLGRSIPREFRCDSEKPRDDGGPHDV